MFGKVTWQINQRMKWMSSLHDEFWTTPQRPTLAQPFQTTLIPSGSRPTATFGQLTDTLTNNTLLDVRVSRFVAPSTNSPATGDRTTPNLWIWPRESRARPAGIRCGQVGADTVGASLSLYGALPSRPR